MIFNEHLRVDETRVKAQPTYFGEHYFTQLARELQPVLQLFVAGGKAAAVGLFTITSYGVVQYHLGRTRDEFLKLSPMAPFRARAYALPGTRRCPGKSSIWVRALSAADRTSRTPNLIVSARSCSAPGKEINLGTFARSRLIRSRSVRGHSSTQCSLRV